MKITNIINYKTTNKVKKMKNNMKKTVVALMKQKELVI